jgi:hypothetical protein
MATRTVKTPPIIQPAREPEQQPAPQRVTGVGERGVEKSVPFVIDGAGRKLVAAPHPQAGAPW